MSVPPSALFNWRDPGDGAVTDSEQMACERIAELGRFAREGRLQTLEPLLPLLLNLKRKPYTLKGHFPFSPLFRARMPSKIVWMAGRQVSKSTSSSADGILRAAMIPMFKTLYLTPRFEQIRRFSGNVVQPLINQSPAKDMWTGSGVASSVLQKDFCNGSQLLFSFALLDADRLRGISCDRINIDEVQDMDRAHIPIACEAMSMSPWAVLQFTGTPKTFDNTIHGLWSESSQAEWFVPCYRCTTNGKPTQNIPAIEYHLDAMIGPWHENIGPDCPGVICHNCGNPIQPRQGRWQHRYGARRWDFAGFHVPQLILPHHYEDSNAWGRLIAKRESLSPTLFYNEVLGCSYDVGTKLVTLTELEAASRPPLGLPWRNNPRGEPDPQVFAALPEYQMTALGIDWGGGGKTEDSYTKIALCGLGPDGKISVLWGRKLLTPHDHVREAREILEWYRRFRVPIVAHDYTGAGVVRETIMVQAGTPLSALMPIVYERSASVDLVRAVAATAIHPRHHFRADKTRSLLYVCYGIKLGFFRFFEHDYIDDINPGLIRDFLALIDEKVENYASRDPYIIRRQQGVSDDFAHAVNLASLALWHHTGKYPDFAAWAGIEKAAIVTDEQISRFGNATHGWEEDGFAQNFLALP